MSNAAKVVEHMTVYGSDGGRVGTVDKVEGDRIKLTKNDPEANGEHHLIPVAWVQTVDSAVRLSKEAAAAKREWLDG